MRRGFGALTLAVALLVPAGAFGEPPIQTSRTEALSQFREILIRLSEHGDFRRSAAELAELELQWASLDSLEVLTDAKVDLLRYLAKEQSNAAYPTAILFGALYEWYELANQPNSAARAISLVGVAGDLYRGSRDSRQQADIKRPNGSPLEDPSVRSRNLSRIGLVMIHGGDFDRAIGSFLWPAVRIDPNATAPVHLLAALSEKTDDFQEALRYLEKLLQRAPDDAQARLRQAMVQKQVGKDSVALPALESLIEAEPPPHI